MALFDLPSETERKGFSTATIARMSNDKLKGIGFKPKYNMEDGIKSTLTVMKEASNG